MQNHENIIDQFISQKKYNSAIRYISEQSQNNPKFQISKLQLRLDYIIDSLPENIENPDICFHLAYIHHYHVNNFNFAKIMYDKSIKKDPTNTKYLFNKAKLLYYEFGHLQQAKSMLYRCIQLDSTKACVYHHFGKILIDLLEKDQLIIHALSMAIKLKPAISQYHFVLAKFYHSKHKYHEANYLYNIALKLTNYDDASIKSQCDELKSTQLKKQCKN